MARVKKISVAVLWCAVYAVFGAQSATPEPRSEHGDAAMLGGRVQSVHQETLPHKVQVGYI
jgi:hypothetical protein